MKGRISWAVVSLLVVTIAAGCTPREAGYHKAFLPLVAHNWTGPHKAGISWPKEDPLDRSVALASIGGVATMDWGRGSWRAEASAQHGIEFLPMWYDCNVNPADVAHAAQEHPGARWLVFNEPDNSWQADCKPEDAAIAYHALWEAFQEADPTARLYCCGTTTYPAHVSYHRWWSEAYYQIYGEWPKVDGFHLHSYAPAYSDRLNWENRQAELEYFRQWQQDQEWAKGKPVIISEWGVFGMQADVPAIVAEYLPQMFSYFERTTWIELHLWFCTYEPQFSISGIFEGDSDRLTPIGEAWKKASER